MEERSIGVTEAAGTSGRLARLYELHAPGATRLAYLLVGDQHLADDLVQEAFVKLAGRFADLRNPDAFDAYLRKTVVNLARMHFRRRRVERAFLERARHERERRAAQPDVEEFLRMKEALLALPPRQRAAVVLRYYEDLPERQIAEILRCRPGTVKSLLSRAMQSLRGSVGGDLDE